MTTQLARRRGGRGLYKRRPDVQPDTGRKRSTVPEYLEAAEVEALIRAAPDARTKLCMLVQWRAGLRISEAVALEVADLHLDTDPPALLVRSGKGGKSRLVPLHAELHGALRSATSFGEVRSGRLIRMSRTTAHRRLKDALARAIELGQIAGGKWVGTHTLRHSFARHCLASGVPINVVSQWLGHADLKTTLVYLKLLADPLGFMERVP